MEQVAIVSADPPCQRKILTIANGEIDLDRIELRNRSEHRLSADKISNLGGGLTRHARNQRTNLGKFEIEIRSRHRGLCGSHGGFGLSLLLNLVIELAPGDGAGFSQRRVAVHVDLGEGELCLSLSQLSLRLLERSLKWTGIDLEQNSALFDLRTLAIILANQVSVGLRLDLSVDITIERAHPLTVYGHIVCTAFTTEAFITG